MADYESLKTFRCYLIGNKFTVRTYHISLQSLRNFKDSVGQVARWLELLVEYDFEIVHRPEVRHGNADALSRYPVCTVQKTEQWIHPNFKIDFRKNQAKDCIISILFTYMNTKKKPEPKEMEVTGTQLRYYWARFDKLKIEDNLL